MEAEKRRENGGYGEEEGKGLEGGEGKGKGSVGGRRSPEQKFFTIPLVLGTILEGSKHTLVLAVPEFLYIVYSVG